MTAINTSPLVKKYTLEEFWQLPEPEDRVKYELIAGVLYMTPPPEQTHDSVVSRLMRIVILYLAAKNDKGTLYVPRAAIWTSPATYLEPDLFYVSAELEARLDPKHRTTADLVVEVVSPGSAIYDRNAKADTYAALNVQELWLIDEKEEAVEVRCRPGDGYGSKRVFKRGERIVSSVFPDLILLVDKLFED